MEYRDGVIWQIGERGRLYTTPDLENWIPFETGTLKSLRGITFLGSTVFISGEEGTILSGTRPDALSIRTLGTTNWLEGIAASPNSLVTVGDNGVIYFSSNGTDWERRGNFTTWLRSVAYGANRFICVGEDGFVATSSDGRVWEEINSDTTAHLNKVAWINDRFWIVGEGGTVLTNTFRMALTPVNVGVTNTLFTVSGNSNEVLIAGDQVLLVGDLATGLWAERSDADTPNLAPLWPYYSSLWDGRLFLVGGRTGLQVEGFRTNATAPMHWYSDVQPTRSWLWSAWWTSGFYVAVGSNGTVLTSEDGVEWSREATPQTVQESVLLGVGGNTNVLVAVGSDGTLIRSENTFTNVVSTNLNGEIVTNQVSLFGLIWNTTPVATAQDLQGVAATANRIVVTGGSGTILNSANGLVWQPSVSGVTSFLSGVTSWPQGFVAVGDGGVILTSADGVIWRRRTSPVQDWIYAVRWVGGKLVAVGENGIILTSNDAVTWTRAYSGTSEWLNDVTFAKGIWHAAGSGGLIVTSTDAVAWTPTKAITAQSLYSAASDGDQVIMVGMEGVILRRSMTAPETPVNIGIFDHAPGADFFLFSGEVDQRFILEEAAVLGGSWSEVATLEIADPSGTLSYELSRPENSSTKFFRTRLITTR